MEIIEDDINCILVVVLSEQEILSKHIFATQAAVGGRLALWEEIVVIRIEINQSAEMSKMVSIFWNEYIGYLKQECPQIKKVEIIPKKE